jgi:hypothetical protein
MSLVRSHDVYVAESCRAAHGRRPRFRCSTRGVAVSADGAVLSLVPCWRVVGTKDWLCSVGDAERCESVCGTTFDERMRFRATFVDGWTFMGQRAWYDL